MPNLSVIFIRPLCRWEIENYLLDPEEIENILADLGKDAPRKNRPVEIVIGELLQHCDTLIPVMAANILLHQKNKTALSVSFSSDIANRKDMKKRTQNFLINNLDDENDMESYEDYIQKIESFAENHPMDSWERWDRLNRMIDGKRIYRRITNEHNLSKKFRFQLARHIKEKNGIDQEILNLVEDFKQHCPA